MKRIAPPSPKHGQRMKVTPGAVDRGSTNSARPHFSLCHMVAGLHCIDSCEATARSVFADALWRRSRLTWGELLQAPRQGLGFEKIPRSRISVPIPQTITEDVQHFLVFRAGDETRLIGFRSADVLHIVWFDTKLDAYAH